MNWWSKNLHYFQFFFFFNIYILILGNTNIVLSPDLVLGDRDTYIHPNMHTYWFQGNNYNNNNIQGMIIIVPL